jgi:hypothetical protein
MGKGASLTKTPAPTQSAAPTASGTATRANQARANGYIPSGGGKTHGAIVTAGEGSVGAASGGHGKDAGHKPGASSAGSLTIANGHAVSAAGTGAGANAPGQLKKN